MSLPQVLIKDKYCLTIDEAVAYFNIGEKRMRKIVEENQTSDFIIQNGVKTLIKRKKTRSKKSYSSQWREPTQGWPLCIQISGY